MKEHIVSLETKLEALIRGLNEKLQNPSIVFGEGVDIDRSEDMLVEPGKTLLEVLRQSEQESEYLSTLAQRSLRGVHSGLLSYLREIPTDHPGFSLLRYRESLQGFEHVAQETLALAIGTSLAEIGDVDISTHDGAFLTVQGEGVEQINPDVFRANRVIHQTNGTIDLGTALVQDLTLFLEGTAVEVVLPSTQPTQRFFQFSIYRDSSLPTVDFIGDGGQWGLTEGSWKSDDPTWIYEFRKTVELRQFDVEWVASKR